jgi:hypothetical protein
MAVIKVKSCEEAAKAIVEMVQKNLQEFCPHTYGEKIKVIQSTVTCETTVIVCAFCQKELTEPKIECR